MQCYHMRGSLHGFIYGRRSLLMQDLVILKPIIFYYNKKLYWIIIMQNLKEFVCKFIEKEKNTNFPHLYIVDKETGPFRRIQDAIDAAEPNSLIKVTEGFYQENLLIQKPLTIEPKVLGNSTQKIGVVLLVQSGIGIHVKMPYSDNQVHLSGLKVSHTGNTSQLQMELIEHQHILNIFQKQENQSEQLQHQYLTRVTFNKLENMIMFVQVGKVFATGCVFSLKYLVKSCKMLIPSICVDREGELTMSDSQLKGNQSKDTIGILCKLGMIDIKNCVISDHKEGGILTWGVRQNSSKLMKNKIQRNSIGIHAMGQQFKLKIMQNQINNNKIGIKVGLACEIEISRNSICQNTNGVEVYSSFPIIYLNKINKNKENGIIARTYKKLICSAKIKKNVSITGNEQNGILIEGQNNRTKIVQNYLIGFNLQSGILITKDANPLVLKNKIYKNYTEGILITQDASAVIEKNFISHNIQCNIALGGAASHQTLIVENSIKHSPGAGINIIEGICNVSRNDVTENLSGIRLIDSADRIRRNYIANNEDNGIICDGQCNPTLVDNLITRNCSMGLFVREEAGLQSEPIIYSNIIVSNQINVGLEFNNESIAKSLKASNTIEGPIEKPKGVSCQLM